MATTQPTPETRPDPARNLRWQPLLGPHPGDPQRTASEPYTATDAGAGITTDRLQAWQNHRAESGTFVHADATGVAGSAGPPYTDRPGAGPVTPNLVLTDDSGRQLALNGTPCGFDGEGPRGAAHILAAEGLLTEQAALPTIKSRHQLTVHRAVPAPEPGVLRDAIALDPAQLQAWLAQERWREACSAVDPRLPTDPHYPALAAALDRVDAAGVDAQVVLALAARDGQLPDANPGRALHFRLTSTCDAAVTPAPPPVPGGAAPAAPTGPQPPSRPAPARTKPRS